MGIGEGTVGVFLVGRGPCVRVATNSTLRQHPISITPLPNHTLLLTHTTTHLDLTSLLQSSPILHHLFQHLIL